MIPELFHGGYAKRIQKISVTIYHDLFPRQSACSVIPSHNNAYTT
jgi:hypothetical protein